MNKGAIRSGRDAAGVAVLLLSMLWTQSAWAGYRSMVVTVTAYNSVQSQTDSNPQIAAWSDKLKPGMRAVAVSRDLLGEGLKQGTKVAIQGFKKDFVVMDKMAPGIRRTLDIYMGQNVKKAREFGRQQLRIWWYAKDGTASH